MKIKLYQFIARKLVAIENCEESGNMEWHEKHTDALNDAIKTHLPHGSGFDAGCSIDMDATKPNRLVINADFHHMDEHGHYDGWSDHQVVVTPSLSFDFDLRVTGRNRNMIKEFIADTFNDILNREI